MKKRIFIVFAALVLAFAGWSATPPEESYSEPALELSSGVPEEEPALESSEPEEEKPMVIKREMPQSDELLEHLLRQVYLYEVGSYGFPLKASGTYPIDSWFTREEYETFGAENPDVFPDIFYMYENLFGNRKSEHFSRSIGPAEVFLELDINDYKISEKKVTLTVSRTRNGIKLTDNEYVFTREEATEEFLKGDAADFSIGGYYWRFESVNPTANLPEYEVVTISTPEELLDFCTRVNELDPAAVNGRFVLGNDIDMNGTEFYPIGYQSDISSAIYAVPFYYAENCMGFNGEFDGAGYKISGIDILVEVEDNYNPPVGFFGIIGPHAYVHDLTVSGSVSNGSKTKRTANSCIGGFAGEIYSGATVENCRFEGTVEGLCYVGGFAGRIGYDFDFFGVIKNLETTVNGCSADALVTANFTSGGFTGATKWDIENCEATGILHIVNKGHTPSSIGGFIGEIPFGNIYSCKSAVRLEYGLKSPNWMGNFAGELHQNDIIDCVIDPDCLHEGWYLVGRQNYKGRTIEIAKEDWYEEASDLSAEQIGSGVVIKTFG